MLTTGLLDWAARYGYIAEGSMKASSPMFMALATVIALFCYYRQLSTAFQLGVIEGFFLLPLHLAEKLLVAFVGAAPSPSSN